MNRLVHVYRRRDGIYVIPHGVTTQGFSIETEPYEFLPSTSSTEEIWIAVQKALSAANRPIPHPLSWKEEKSWYRKAGVNNWQQFASQAFAASIQESQGEYTFNRLVWQGGNLIGLTETKFSVEQSTPHREIMAALMECLKTSPQ